MSEFKGVVNEVDVTGLRFKMDKKGSWGDTGLGSMQPVVHKIHGPPAMDPFLFGRHLTITF